MALTAVLEGAPVPAAESAAGAWLAAQDFAVDYLVLRRESNLGAPDVAYPQHRDLVALAAARLGNTRLIDNLALAELND
jgi:pantoate--beta-alanine ligase